MVAHISSFAFAGIDVIDIDVQVNLSSGMPCFTIVGLADKAVAESKERVRSAIGAIGLSLPPERVTVNLAPADIVKEGSHYDLPIALGLLVSMGIVPQDALDGYVVLGELALDGNIAPINGVLPSAMAALAQDLGIICPKANASEALWAGDIEVLAADNVLDLIHHFKGQQILPPAQKKTLVQEQQYPDMSEIKGQEVARRALEIAAAGGHNMLMVGPPGSGKSMLAARLPGLLPELTAEEMLQVSMVHSIVGDMPEGGLVTKRPFRDPHHNCSMPAMIGGGPKAKPGEVTLAHGGILFLDELAEFPRQVLDSLRQPLEAKKVTVSRVQAHITYPANFQLVAAMNPCRCGYLDDASRACNKAPKCAVDYQSKLSGPLLDRIDIHVEVPAIRPSDVYKSNVSENTQTIAKRVQNARKIQSERYKGKGCALNAMADGEVLLHVAQPDNKGKEILEKAIDQMGLSMRGHNRILRVARTIADMQAEESVSYNHIVEALSYRQIRYNN